MHTEDVYASFRYRTKWFELLLFCLWALLPIALLIARIQLIAEGRGLHMWGIDAVIYPLFILWFLRIRRLRSGRGVTLRLSSDALTVEQTGRPGWLDLLKGRIAGENDAKRDKWIVHRFARADVACVAVDKYHEPDTSTHFGRFIAFVSLKGHVQHKLFMIDEIKLVDGIQLSEFIKTVDAWVEPQRESTD